MKKSNRTLLISALSAASLIAVAGALNAQTPADASPPAAVDAAVVESTRGIAGQLLNQLGAKLKAAISTDGPMAAVSVCKEAAPSIARSLSAEHGVQRPRRHRPLKGLQQVCDAGGLNGLEVVHEGGVDRRKEALAQFDTRLAQGEKPANLEFWQVVETASGKRELHYAKAIMVQPQCLACHGQAQDISAPMAEKIKQEYPDDQATGYSAGKLRGAVVITKPL